MLCLPETHGCYKSSIRQATSEVNSLLFLSRLANRVFNVILWAFPSIFVYAMSVSRMIDSKGLQSKGALWGVVFLDHLG